MVLLTMDFLCSRMASTAATRPTGQFWSKRFWQGSPRSRARRLVTRCAAPDKQVARLYPRKSGLLWWQLPRGNIQTYCAMEGETLCLHAQVIPDTSDGKVRYHNDLMKACGLTLRELIAAMNKTTEASEKSEQDRRAKRTRNEWHRAAVPAARHKIIKGENGIGAKNANEAM